MSTSRDDDGLPLSRRPPVNEDVERELEFHLHERARDFMARGLSPEQAWAAARESFGDQQSVTEECVVIEKRRRSTRRRVMRLDALVQDLRLGARLLRRSSGFTMAAVLTLALGIGANSAVFSLVNRVILQPLPYAHADRLMTIVERHKGGGTGSMPWANFLDIEHQAHSFVAMTSYGSGPTTVLSAGAAVRVNAAQVSRGFFQVFPIRPFKGRLTDADDHGLGANPVAVVSHAFWRDHLGAAASLEGVHVKLFRDYEVVGVLPPEFDFPDGNSVWVPMDIEAQSMSRTSHNWDVLAQLRPGVTRTAAARELDALLASLKPRYYPDFDAEGANVASLQDALIGGYRTPLYLLLAASAVVLLAACVNIASTLLARGTARAGEFAVRAALGATRVRLVRQLLSENALLALLGCAAGLMLAAVLLRVLAQFAPLALHAERVRVDGWVIAFGLVVALATTALFGLYPALRLSGDSDALSMREGGRGTGNVTRMRAWNVLIATEIALAVVLLSNSALLIKSFAHVMESRLGFEPANVLTFRLDLPAVNYGDTSVTVRDFHERLLAQLHRQPGIEAVGFTNILPLGGSNPSGSLEVEGKPLDPRGRFNAYAVYRVGGGQFFDAMRIPLLKGRVFRDGAIGESSPVVIVSETMAKREWPNEDPIGKRLRVAGMDGGTEPWYTVIGIVGDVRSNSATSPFANTYYFDHRERPAYRTRNVSYVVRSRLDVAALAGTIRREVAALDAQVPVSIQGMPERVARSSAGRKFPMLVLGAFAGVALLLAVVGINGVVSYAVSQRTREIGVRLALGATPVGILRLVLASAGSAIVPGIAVGAVLSIGAARTLQSLLYGVAPFDLPALATACALLGVAAALAGWVPARRATRIDPLAAMRSE